MDIHCPDDIPLMEIITQSLLLDQSMDISTPPNTISKAIQHLAISSASDKELLVYKEEQCAGVNWLTRLTL